MKRRFARISLPLASCKLRMVVITLSCLLISAVVIFSSNPVVFAAPEDGAPSTDLLNTYRAGTWAYDPNATECFDLTTSSGGATATNSRSQEDNIKIILGAVKAYDLPKEAGIIAIMTALTESNIRMMASKKLPISQENPAWQVLPQPRPIGNDHDSVGIFQQRISTGWSTFGNGEDKDIVWQLMDPAYSAQAFLGTPANSSLPAGLKQPGALRKGLQNKQGWSTMDPWVAAQKVQVSFDSTGGNYKKNYDRAVSLANQYWDTAVAIKLPIPVTAGGGTGDDANPANVPGSAGNASDCSSTITGGNLAQIISAYSWHEYHKKPYFVMTAAYQQAVDNAKKNGGYAGGGMHPGIDCGGYMTILMRDSGRDPTYNKKKGPVTAQEDYVKSMPGLYQLIQTDTTDALKFGDIGMIDSHTYMFVGKGMEEAGIKDYKGNSTSASFGGDSDSGSWRTPMASDAYNISEYRWYRWLGTEKPASDTTPAPAKPDVST